MIPFSLTITFKNLSYYTDEICYGISNNYINDNVNSKYAIELEINFRLIVNKFTSELIGSRNVTRNSHINKVPIMFYTMEQMDYLRRKDMLFTTKGASNISPLHYHGIFFIIPSLIEKIQSFLGKDLLNRFHNRIQGSEINECYDISGWINYINKTENDVVNGNDKFNKSFFIPYGGVYPSYFKNNPDEFLSNVIAA